MAFIGSTSTEPETMYLNPVDNQGSTVYGVFSGVASQPTIPFPTVPTNQSPEVYVLEQYATLCTIHVGIIQNVAATLVGKTMACL